MRRIPKSPLFAPAVILLLFTGSLIGADRLAFRDVSHFYTPLYDYVGRRTADELLPLWNPLDQTGLPLIGESSTAVLYPVRYLLYRLPLSAEMAMAWYVVLHLILASATAFLAARLCGMRRLSATLGGIVYPLSGSVLFLYSNPPFLVGAAWMPLVLGMLVTKQEISLERRTLLSAVAMAMMLLGGDAQMALHVMIVAACVCICRAVQSRRLSKPTFALITIPLLAAALAAPQLVASLSWSRQSDRVKNSTADAWYEPPTIGDRKHESYQFSFPPWHALELLTPNAFGSLLPIYRRVSVLIPGDGRMWTPTIYMGMIVIVALIDRIARLGRDRMDVWLGVMLGTTWLACGHFGLIWVVQSVTGHFRQVDSAVGGPYWILYQCFPGYDCFRYPAKWLPFVSLGAAMVTARWLEESRWRRAVGPLVASSLLCVAGLCVASWLRIRPELLAEQASAISDEYWGPIDLQGGLAEVQYSFLHSLITLGMIATVVWQTTRRHWVRRQAVKALLAITLIELAISGRGIVATLSVSQERELIIAANEQSALDAPPIRWMRQQTDSGWPSVWSRTSDESRLLDVEVSQRASWFGRWHLASNSGMLNNMVSIQSNEMRRFWDRVHQQLAAMNVDQRDAFWNSIRSELSIGGVVQSTSDANSIESHERTATLVSVFRRVGMEPRVLGSDPSLLKVNSSIVEVNRDDEGWYRRPVLQDGHWAAKYRVHGERTWQPAIVHADGIAQQVYLPAGRLELRFDYSPWWIKWTFAIAIISWGAVTVLFIRANRRRSLLKHADP